MSDTPSPRRTDRAGETLIPLDSLRKPLAGDVPVAEIINPLVREGTLYEKLDGGKVHCYACAHDCTISDGGRGICQVRYNVDGTLYVPHGYVAALQCDPTEKKPFNHVHPGSDTLTFGMLGCDLHCSYCFTGDTVVMTDRGPLRFDALFESVDKVTVRPDGEVAFPDDLRAIAGSGQWQAVDKVFRHHYEGKLAVIKPYYLPELRCTADHRVYATADVGLAPQPIHAQNLTTDHYLAIPLDAVESTPIMSEVHALTSPLPTLTASPSPLQIGEGWPSLAKRSEVGVRSRPLIIHERVIATEDFLLVPIEATHLEDFAGDVYNMEVAVEHNYLAGYVLVKNCQNWDISQAMRDANAGRPPSPVSADDLVRMAVRNKARCVASSYNEPLITSEWAVDVFKQAKAAGFTTMYVSNGNATRGVLEYIRPHTDGYKIDLKTMSAKNYRSLGGVLDHILDGVRMVHELGFWLEIVTLVIPGWNSSEDELREAARFLVGLSPDIPWHVTAFHKDYKMTDPDNTDAKLLKRAAEIGYEEGLRYVYAGNMPGRVGPYEHTFCPKCEAQVVRRFGYVVLSYDLTPDGKCHLCGTSIPGIWPESKQDVRLGTEMDLYTRRPRSVR